MRKVKVQKKKKEVGYGYTIGVGPYKGQRVYILKVMFHDNNAYQKDKRVTQQSRYCKNVRTIAKDPMENKSYGKKGLK